MCLLSEKLHMKFWPEYNTYFGTGYKILSKYYDSFDIWQEACGWYSEKHNSKKGLPLDGKDNYPAGFHIFLTIKDAILYDKSSYENTNNIVNIYKVDFTDVIGFGKQRVTDNSLKDCVISRWMYVHKNPVSVWSPEIERPINYIDGCTCGICNNYTNYLKKNNV